MLKALFKKEMLEAFSAFVMDRKTKKLRSKKGIIGMSALYIFLLGYLMVMFYFMADFLCEPLVAMGFSWLYMALMAILSLAPAVFGSVFSTYTTLYAAKDNDLLLSMPIPTNTILTARLSGIYAMGLMYELIVFIPALVVYFIKAPFNLLGTVFCVIIPFVLSFFVLSLSCVLGWVVAIVSSRLKNKNIITVVLSLGFIAAYYYLIGDMEGLISKILNNPAGLGEKIKGFLYPIYKMGKAAEGDMLSMALFVAIIFAVFAVVYLVLRQSFLKLATTNRGAKKKKYVERKAVKNSVDKTLLIKEFRRFISSANYMLNCGFGMIIMLVVAVFLLIKQKDIVLITTLIGYKDIISLILCGAACMMTTMCDFSAPSVSLEGKNIWVLQTLPVSGWAVLRAKLNMHLILTLIPVAVLITCVEIVFKPSLLFAIMIPITVVLFVLLMAVLGLAINLKLPNLNWTNEVIPIKQSASVGIVLFGGWVVIIALGVLYYFLPSAITPSIYIIGVSVLFAAVDAGLLYWLKHKGGRIFEKL